MARDKLNHQRVVAFSGFFPTEGTFAFAPPTLLEFSFHVAGFVHVMENLESQFIFQSWKVIKINSRSLKVMEN